jgi:hypothetical protein
MTRQAAFQHVRQEQMLWTGNISDEEIHYAFNSQVPPKGC